jgi:mono/diheme cytochrome c family protein
MMLTVMSGRSSLRLLFATFFVAISFQLFAAGDAKAGKALFINNCASCHNKNMKSKLTGPALGGVEARWAAYPKSDLYGWIRNSAVMIAKGHPRAVEVYNEYAKSNMTAFPALKDEEIDNMLAYVNEVVKNDGVTTTPVIDPKGPAAPKSNTMLYLIIATLLGGLAYLLNRIVRGLALAETNATGAAITWPTIGQMLTGRTAIGVLIFALVVIGGYTMVNNAIGLSRQQNYSPDQPIKFSHATHSGLQKIDCQYCHDGSRRSKHSIIPATNTCMNCHKAVKVGSQHGTAEITKIFASAGYDPTTDKYIENYDKLDEKQIAAIYQKWIFAQAKEVNKDLTVKAANLVAATQWDGVVASLTTKDKSKVGGPIPWKRVHNLPDHAYFNHAQHVAVGQVACTKCHGPVETMEVLKQFAPLSMGWCINCHRQTEVKFADNPYYNSYERYHNELKAGTREKVTVEDIGGLECQKCHY